MNIENQAIDLHPKANLYLLYSGTISLLILLPFMLLGGRLSFFGGFLLGNIAFILMGLRYRITPKYISLKWLDRLAGAIMLVGTMLLCYDLIFNILPNF